MCSQSHGPIDISSTFCSCNRTIHSSGTARCDDCIKHGLDVGVPQFTYAWEAASGANGEKPSGKIAKKDKEASSMEPPSEEMRIYKEVASMEEPPDKEAREDMDTSSMEPPSEETKPYKDVANMEEPPDKEAREDKDTTSMEPPSKRTRYPRKCQV